MYSDYLLWAASLLCVIAAAFHVWEYCKTKEKRRLFMVLCYSATAAVFLLWANSDRTWKMTAAENELRNQRMVAKNKMNVVSARTPEAAGTAVKIFVSDLRDSKLAKSLARASEDYRVAWQEYVRSCTDMADELKALGPAAPDPSLWVNGAQPPTTAKLPDQLRQKLQAVQNADQTLEALDRRRNPAIGGSESQP